MGDDRSSLGGPLELYPFRRFEVAMALHFGGPFIKYGGILAASLESHVMLIKLTPGRVYTVALGIVPELEHRLEASA